ncbi:alpha-glycosidase [Clostridium sp. YIM B02515]|uniref:Alpha-glycosidase n=1 Tax=Clostridium rhizosphaerae TaxID=2803861 RepID=A0ABS1T564_9CLOT|nr:alpha-glycosidase [Clostridium rhizosphaerae]MBL4934460.1 alpha-glycosidase [Clostridium rhizosphaerae]
MNKHAVYHVVDVPYAYAKDKDTLTVRIRTARNDVKVCKVYYKCRYDWTNPFEVQEMKLMSQSELFDYYEADIKVEKNRYRYFFELLDNEGNNIYFDDRGFRGEVEKPEATGFQFAYIGEADVYEEVKWLQEAVVYQVFPDRFYNGDKANDPENTEKWGGEITQKSMFGGDLQGIIEKLDYLKELGITLLYLTPVFKSTSNHKYNTADYFDIDTQFGTIETAKELVVGCHERGIKIVFDAVFNHSGSDFFAFEDLLKNQENSKYKDWYFPYEYPVSLEKINYYTFANGAAYMPKLNTANEEVKEYLLKVGEYWVKEIGIDGWRLDVCDEVDHQFWKAFRKRVKAVNKEAVIIGEIMHEASSFLRGDELDTIMNYPFKGAMVDFFAVRKINEVQFDNILTMNRTIYMDSVIKQMWNLFDSHDTKRFLTECDGDVEKMKLAIAFQFSYMGVPYIYYGDEVGMAGGDDPQCRGCMVWDKEKQNTELLELYKKLIAVRHENKALVHGEYKEIYLRNNVVIFERSLEDETIIVAINNNDEAVKAVVEVSAETIDLVSGKAVSIENELQLDKMEFKILKVIR